MDEIEYKPNCQVAFKMSSFLIKKLDNNELKFVRFFTMLCQNGILYSSKKL